MFKLPIFLVALSLLQVSFCAVLPEEIEDVELDNELTGSRAKIIAQLSAKVLELQLNISSTSLAEGSSLAGYVTSTRTDVDVARKNVDGHLKELDQQVKNATVAAKEQDKKIDVCVKAEKKDKKKLNVRSISKCSAAWSLNVLKLKLAKFSAVSLKTYYIIPRCTVAHPFDNDKLEECALQLIADYDKEMRDVKASLEAEALDLVKKADDCILENAKELNAAIKEISNTFAQCVESL